MKKLIQNLYYPSENELNSNQRNYFIDNAKFLLMVLVVVGHFGLKQFYLPQIKHITYFIYVFHMPCFIFISGFLAKRMNVGGKLRIEKIITIIFLYILFKGGYVLLGYVFNKR